MRDLGRRCYLVYFLFVAARSSLCSSVAEQQRWCHCWSRAACHVVSTDFVLVNYEQTAYCRQNTAVIEFSALNWVSLMFFFWNWKPATVFIRTWYLRVFKMPSVLVAASRWQWYGTVEVQPPACWNRALEGRGWSGSHPGSFPVVKEPWTQVCRGWVGPRTSLNALRSRGMCYRWLESNRYSSVVQSVATVPDVCSLDYVQWSYGNRPGVRHRLSDSHDV